MAIRRSVTPRTLRGAQASAESLYQSAGASGTTSTPIPARTPNGFLNPASGYTGRDSEALSARWKTLGERVNIPAAGYKTPNQYVDVPPSGYPTIQAPTQPGDYEGIGGEHRVAGRSRYVPGPVDPLKAQFDKDTVIASLWNQYQSAMITNKATADQMIADAIDAAAQPYDEKLQNLGRSIDETRGKMNDLDKITDWYQSTLVGIWEKAAEAGRGVDGGKVEQSVAAMAAEVGKAFDVGNANVQEYLDRVGGVPPAQRLVIEDTIRSLQNPFEGVLEADIQGWINQTDAYGNVLETAAYAESADARFDAEANRFSTDGFLDKTLADQEWDQNTTIANRTRAVDRAKRQANAQYAFTEKMPDRAEFVSYGLEDVMNTFGLDDFEKTQYSSWLDELYSGNFEEFWQPDGTFDEDGNPNGTIPRITNTTEFNAAWAAMDPSLRDEDSEREFQILFDLLDSRDALGGAWDAKQALFKGTGGGGRKGGGSYDNKALWNAKDPDTMQRAAYVTDLRTNLPNMFPGMIKNIQQMRPHSMGGGSGQSANSDHYSNGALDIFPTSVEDGKRMEREMDSWPNVDYIIYRDNSAHMDHLHVSFLRPSQIDGSVNAVVHDYSIDAPQKTNEGYVTSDDIKRTFQSFIPKIAGY